MEYALRSASREGGPFTDSCVIMFYGYILNSMSSPGQRYIGFTADMQKRLEEHYSGKSPHTAKYVPWKLANYFAFETADKARGFEDYLKSGSGHAFVKNISKKSITTVFNFNAHARVRSVRGGARGCVRGCGAAEIPCPIKSLPAARCG